MRRLRGRVTVALLLATLAGAAAQSPECARWRKAFAAMPDRTVAFYAADLRSMMVLRTKAAETPEQQAAGFQCATLQEIRDHLILFDFGREILTQFHMQNVPASLDIAFAKADGRIFAILRMDPHPTALYGPTGPFRYALEAPADFFAARGIKAGVKLEVEW